MPRCVAPPRLIARTRRLVLVMALAGSAIPAAAQGSGNPSRHFPATALRGLLEGLQPPQMRLNGQPARLAPGARIRSMDNLLLLQGALAGQRMEVHYTRDLTGALLDVWILTPAERAKQPWPATPEQAAAWRFDPVGQRWSRP
jgi:hypothetical protein